MPSSSNLNHFAPGYQPQCSRRHYCPGHRLILSRGFPLTFICWKNQFSLAGNSIPSHHVSLGSLTVCEDWLSVCPHRKVKLSLGIFVLCMKALYLPFPTKHLSPAAGGGGMVVMQEKCRGCRFLLQSMHSLLTVS